MQKKIVFTGGGSAGHVTPNIAVINELDQSDWDIYYVGSKEGIEKELIERRGIRYHSISSGKLRRYIDWQNITDIFRVVKGCFEARKYLKKIKPNVVFSKGGFVTVPVIIAAKTLNIPVIIHESDITPGLANRIAQRFATKIFTSFDEATAHFPSGKAKALGSPVRKEITHGDKRKGLDFLQFGDSRPVLTVMGGSLGAKKINETVRASLPWLTEKYQVVHLCGKGHTDESLEDQQNYRQFEYVNEELPDVLAATNTIITRGGSNSIFEFLTLHLPMLIVPLTRAQSRGDQILNAESFQEKGYAAVLEEEKLSEETLRKALQNIEDNRNDTIAQMKTYMAENPLDLIIRELYVYH